MALDAPINSTIGSDDRRNLHYRVQLDRAGVVKFALGTMPNGGQVSIELSDAQRHVLSRLLFEAGAPGERIFQIASPGVYAIHLWSGAREPERFSLTLSNTPTTAQGECAVNGNYQCALPATLNERAAGAIGTDYARERYYRLEIPHPGVLRVLLQPAPSHGQTTVTLTDKAYRPLGRMMFEAGEPGERTAEVPAAGTYYVKLWSGTREGEHFALTVQDSSANRPRSAGSP